MKREQIRAHLTTSIQAHLPKGFPAHGPHITAVIEAIVSVQTSRRTEAKDGK